MIKKVFEDDRIDDKEWERTCHCFGGNPWWTEDRGDLCNVSIFDLQTSSKNTCSELDGNVDEHGICSFPLQNVTRLKEREHPRYYENEMDHQAYAVLVECAQLHVLSEEARGKGEKEFIERATRIPVGRVERVEKVEGEKIETTKIREIYLTKEEAKRLLEGVSNILIEDCAQDRYAWRVHGKAYFDLDEKERRKVRYRIRKQFGEF